MSGAPVDRDALLDLLRHHHHSYDRDCDFDFGCTCGDTSGANTDPDLNADYDPVVGTHSEHLADVLLAWLGGAS